jgi:hypothetical protein
MPLGGPIKPGGTEIKWTYQLLAYANDMNLLGDIYAIKETKALKLLHISNILERQ